MTWMYDFSAWADFKSSDNEPETLEEKSVFGCVEDSLFDAEDPKPICNNARLFDIGLNKVVGA